MLPTALLNQTGQKIEPLSNETSHWMFELSKDGLISSEKFSVYMKKADFVCLFGLRVYVPVNNFSVMSGRSHRFLGISSTFWEVNVSCSRIQHGDQSELKKAEILGYSWGIMSRVMRKPVFRASDQVQHKQGCTTTGDGQRLEILDLGSRGIVLSTWRKQRP